MRRRFPLLLLALVAPATLTLGACERSTVAPSETDPTDRLTQELLTKLRLDEHDAALALCNAALAGELGPRDLAVLTRTLAWLGPVAGLSVEAEEAVVEGVRRDYRLRFDRAEVGLSITVVAGKVEGLEFDADEWIDLVDQAAHADAGQLRVAEFHFLDAEGEATAAPPNPADIGYELALEGLGAQLREHHVRIAKSVIDASGAQVYVQDSDDELRFSQAESGASGGLLSGSVAVPGPGEYELVLEIHDEIARTSLDHRVAFTIQ